MPSLITLRHGVDRKRALSRAWAGVKLHVRALACPRLTRDWLHLLNSNELMRQLVHAQPRLVHKVYRPWLSTCFDDQARLAALGSHYRFALRQGWGPLLLRAAHGPVPLCAFDGKSGTPYSVALRAVVPMERDGELVLELRRAGVLVYSAAFSFLADGGRAVVGIGCIQGPACGAGLELCRETTRDLHGLRPKNLLVRLIAQLGHASGCQWLRLVGNGNRAVVRSRRRGKVLADYDTMWRELGAEPRSDGDFEYPCTPLAAPDLEQVPSRKRAEARRRHALLEQACAALVDCMPAAALTHPEPLPTATGSTIGRATAACAVPN
ncbi:hypothetical protein IP92_01792 [Pseudoduganella flava]|uniref:DUF535 domain-containing protein n=1 Tax=Pseudoduganella flava TaxID=871742 RepID=A0A562PVK3_9BURK|nr:DUF535 family protein [Pseudoduganella flava]QGZ39513.1 DUF535 domain-containing protein [Pseudoduganella flava]TWI48403.1 hypothetical protein IP92_01792 [Pseudoduganella flava]